MAALRVPQVSQLLAGKYRIERHLGEGGMGYVVAARHLELDELVAIKLVHPELLHSTPVAERFLREAKRVVRIKSQHVVRVLDVDRTESGQPFIVMEYLDGCDLSAIVRGEDGSPRVRPSVVVDWMLQAMDAIAEAHSLGIVHRDLKPANLFLAQSREGALSIKVVDFGISKTLVQQSGYEVAITRTRDVVGSPPYMSPEQMRAAKNVDGRTDIWSLGVIFYRLLSGRLPFDGESLPEVFAQVYASEPPPLRAVAPHVPAGLDEIVHRCLVKARDQRIPSVCELARALTPYASPASARTLARIATFASGARAPGPQHVSSPAATRAPLTTVGGTRRKSAAWPLFAVAALVVLGGFSAWKAKSLLRARALARTEAPRPTTSSAATEDVPPTPPASPSAEGAPSTSIASSTPSALALPSVRPPRPALSAKPVAPAKTTTVPKPPTTPASSSGAASDRHG